MRKAVKRLWRRYVALWQAWCVLTWWGPSDIIVAVNLIRCPCRGQCGNVACEAVLSMGPHRCSTVIPSGRLASASEIHGNLDESATRLWHAICERQTGAPEPIAGKILGSG